MPADQVTVQILDRDYRLACDPGERDALLAAAAHVDARMRDIREQKRVAGAERIAVLAALEVASDLLSRPSRSEDAHEAASADAARVTEPRVDDPETVRRIQSIHALLDTAFVGQERLF